MSCVLLSLAQCSASMSVCWLVDGGIHEILSVDKLNVILQTLNGFFNTQKITVSLGEW